MRSTLFVGRAARLWQLLRLAVHCTLTDSSVLDVVYTAEEAGGGPATACLHARMLTPLIDGLGHATWSSVVPVSRPSKTPYHATVILRMTPLVRVEWGEYKVGVNRNKDVGMGL